MSPWSQEFLATLILTQGAVSSQVRYFNQNLATSSTYRVSQVKCPGRLYLLLGNQWTDFNENLYRQCCDRDQFCIESLIESVHK